MKKDKDQVNEDVIKRRIGKKHQQFGMILRKLELPEGLKKADFKYCKEILATMVVKDPALAL